jgi:hypothetical protein
MSCSPIRSGLLRVRCHRRCNGRPTEQPVGQSVIDITVMRFVGADHEHRDVAAGIADPPGALQPDGGFGDALASSAEHVGNQPCVMTSSLPFNRSRLNSRFAHIECRKE